jgi:hypothetical protein
VSNPLIDYYLESTRQLIHPSLYFTMSPLVVMLPQSSPGLGPEGTNESTLDITNWTYLEVVAAIKTANLMATGCNDAIDFVRVANDTLERNMKTFVREDEHKDTQIQNSG